MAKKDTHEAAAAVATAPEETKPEETAAPVETEAPAETVPAPEAVPAPATVEVDNAEIAAQIANAPAGTVETSTTKMTKEAMALPSDRKRVAVKLGGMKALVGELRPAIWALLNADGRNMTRAERDFLGGLVASADAIEDMSNEGIDVLCGKQPKKRGPFKD